MRTLRRSLFAMAVFASLSPLYMSDESASAAQAEDPNAGASSADAALENGTASSAETANTADFAGTAVEGEAGNVGAASDLTDTSNISPGTDATQTTGSAPMNENTGNVEVAADSHAEAKERFAGVMAKLHQFEQDSVDDLKVELRAIGTLLHLHSIASSSADATGDYKSSDL